MKVTAPREPAVHSPREARITHACAESETGTQARIGTRVPDLPGEAGPFETESEVRHTSAVRAVYEAFRAAPGQGRMQAPNHRMLEEACEAAGVELGAYDHRILLWLAGWEPATCAVVAGLITRAHQGAGIGIRGADLGVVRQALADASAWRAWKAEGAGCGDCQRLDPGRGADHAADDEMAAAYEALLRRLVTEGPVL